MNRKSIIGILSALLLTSTNLFASGSTGVEGGNVDKLIGNRLLTLNTIIRVNQIEMARDRNEERDERNLHTPEKVRQFREAVAAEFLKGKITWGFSWLALHDQTENYKKLHEQIVAYHPLFLQFY